MQKDTARLVHGPVGRHLVEQTAPMLIGIVSIMTVGLVDAYFIGRLGPEPLAAISFIFPVSTALSSVGVGVMVGISSVVSRALGAGDLPRARARASQGIAFALVVGLSVSGLVYLLHDALFRLMNASEQTLPLIRAYMMPYLIGLPLILVAMACNGVLRGQGEAIRSSFILVVVAVFNGGLDWPLIFGLGPIPALGIAGAGWAVVIAGGAAALTGLALLGAGQLGVRAGCLTEAHLGRGAREIGQIGAPAAVSSAINPVGLSVLTAMLATHGEAAVAGFGAAGRVQSFAVVPFLALSASIGAVVGQNVGAGAHDRARRALWLSGLFCLGWGAAIAVPLALWGSEVGRLFSEDPEVVDAVGQYLAIAAWGFAFYGLLVVATGALNAQGRAGTAFGISVARVLVVMAPAAWAGSVLLGPPGVYGAELAANLIGGLAAVWLAWRALS